MVWNDHGAAIRAESLIYYALVAEKEHCLSDSTKKLIFELLEIHGEFLSDESKYTKNHNHGIFQDRALLYIAYILNSDKSAEWILTAEKRLKKQVDFAFSIECIHVENSTSYHIGVVTVLKIICDFLTQLGDDFGYEIYNDVVKKSIRFLTYMTKPNGALAATGDSSYEASANKNYTSSLTERPLHFDDSEYIYACTLGEEGDRPKETSAFYPCSGYYISHNSWDKEDYENSTWMMFKSGYLSKTHKHSDDNSFMLYSKGKDIFDDSGFYNYTFGNRYRDYFVSSGAHNTVIADGRSYSPTDENSGKVGIFGWGKFDGYEYAAGFNDMYAGIFMDRYFYNMGDAILIYDNIKSDNEHIYSQLFHTSGYMEVLKHSDCEVLFSLLETKYNVRIKQLSANTKLEIIKGDFDKEKYGYISKKTNDVSSVYTAKFDVKGSDVNFVTLITIEDKFGNVENLKNFNFDSNDYFFTFVSDSFHIINLRERKRINTDNIFVSQNGSVFQFVNNCIGNGFRYSWYIIDFDSGAAVKKINSGSKNTAECDFDSIKHGRYIVRAYIKNSFEHMKHAVVAIVEYDAKTGWLNKTNEYPYINLLHNGHIYDKIGKNRYRFIIDCKYSLDMSVKWYVYRNGVYFDSFLSKNDNNMEYEFNLPGKYSVAYYLRTREKDNEYWNFPAIEIY
ncbi:MAG: hypothetical protein HFE62_01000 [Firmicutes bacterium]|nr:hypothetical protein [Bacillota bacterium]